MDATNIISRLYSELERIERKIPFGKRLQGTGAGQRSEVQAEKESVKFTIAGFAAVGSASERVKF